MCSREQIWKGPYVYIVSAVINFSVIIGSITAVYFEFCIGQLILRAAEMPKFVLFQIIDLTIKFFKFQSICQVSSVEPSSTITNSKSRKL